MIASRHSFRLLSRKHIVTETPTVITSGKKDPIEHSSTESDSKKRSFLKLAGVVGVGALAASLIPKKAEALVFGSTPTASSAGVKNASNVRINPATQETLASIKTQTDLLTFDAGSNPANLKVNVAAGSVGVKNASDVRVNPATEDTLALIQAKTSQLTFSGSNLMTTVGGTGNTVGIKDTTSTAINPATDESVLYLRRIVKLMESQANVDSSNRQRVVVDGFGGVITGTGASVIGTSTTAGTPRVTVATDSSFSSTITSINGYTGQMFQDVARSTYAVGVRLNLAFS